MTLTEVHILKRPILIRAFEHSQTLHSVKGLQKEVVHAYRWHGLSSLGSNWSSLNLQEEEGVAWRSAIGGNKTEVVITAYQQ